MSAPSYQVLEAARDQADMTFDELWLAYYALGGVMTPEVLRSYLSGGPTLWIDYDVLAQAINEKFVERGGNHPVPYSEDLS
ncbi:MAG: hypothetical protein QOI99_223 [Actinomycetota bacterium]|nr:hypothetical protein [Actinomycetota bacterium]